MTVKFGYIITWIAQPHDLDGCWPESEYLVPGPFGIAVHVDQDVDSVLVDSLCSLAIACYLRKVDEVFSRP